MGVVASCFRGLNNWPTPPSSPSGTATTGGVAEAGRNPGDGSSAGPSKIIWNADIKILVKTLQGHTKEIESVAFSPNGRYVASGSWDYTVKIWDTESGACVRTLEGHSGSVYSVAFSPNGRSVVSGSRDRTVRIWRQ